MHQIDVYGAFRNIHRHHQMKRLSPFFAVISAALAAPLISNAAQQFVTPTPFSIIESDIELAIVDANIANKNLLIRELVRSRPAGQMKVLELTPHADGITQITGHLQSAQQHYKAVHFFAHGEERQIHLGNSTLDDSNLNSYADQFNNWNEYLSDDADLLLYSCRLTGNQRGVSFARALSHLTQKDVAASNDTTGTLGDWELETQIGQINVMPVVVSEWQGNLIDSDGDGADDLVDPDDDNDGIPDTVEGSADPDGDGLPNSLDLDSDNDNLTDSAEAGDNPTAPRDSDGDGIRDFVDPDSDNDGIPDAIETLLQTDGDGLPNNIDLDSDSDGIPDAVEAGSTPASPADSDGDGKADYIDLDSDNDTIPDSIEAGAQPSAPVDTDSDGVADFLDLDSDNDNIVDQTEAGANPAVPPDTDGDGAADYIDLDSDKDQIPDSLEGVTDTDNDGLSDFLDWDSDNDTLPDQLEAGANPAAPIDSDGDSTADFLDTDSDADGIPDSVEADIIAFVPADADSDGVSNYLETDSDNDGIPDAIEAGANATAPVDTDADGKPDYTDTDADADGIPDSFEAGDTPVLPRDSDDDGKADYTESDSDADNIPDSVEAGPNPASPADTDGDNFEDYRDRDSDNDRIPDSVEAGFNAATPADTDSDGTADYLDLDSDSDQIPDTIEAGGNPSTPNDSDNDGLPDFTEIDADNDGIPDTIEAGNNPLVPTDSDADGRPDFTERDSDNDGVSDTEEAGPNLTTPTDANNDGVPDYQDVGTDADGDGIPDSVEQTIDSDGDGIPNYLDLDSDADGIADAIEIARDTDGDNVADFLDSDSDNDGISDLLETAGDHDDDTVQDYRDLDSDNDGIFDLVEAHSNPTLVLQIDADNNGIVDQGNQIGVNGMADVLETSRDSGDINYTIANTDSDPGADFRDLDSDNDGLTDTFETDQFAASSETTNATALVRRSILNVNESGLLNQAGVFPRDTDLDTVADYRDRDSDNDGVSDLVESFGLDENNDGIVDSFLDENGNGLDDTIEDSMLEPYDTDADGIVDSREVDSDADGIADIVENAGIDADNDGRIDSFSDTNLDGVDDNIATTARPPVDSDNDGSPDFQDTDSDNDGINDLEESGGTDADGDNRADTLTNASADRDGDGLPDYLQGDAVLTGLGGGGCSMIPSTHSQRVDPTLPVIALLAGMFLFLRRQTKNIKRIPILLLGTMFLGGCSTSGILDGLQPFDNNDEITADESFSRGVYVAGGIGSSRMEPDTSQVEPFYRLNDRVEPGAQVAVGYDINENFAVEAHTADLGSAGLSPSGRINYHTTGVSGMVYLGNNKRRFKRQGLTSFGRVGVGAMNNSPVGGVAVKRLNKGHYLFGAGVEYMTKSGFGARVEGVVFDEDAKYAQMAMVYRFGVPQYPELPMLPQTSAQSTVIEEFPTEPLQPQIQRVQAPQKIEVPARMQASESAYNNCNNISGVLDGVRFISGSADLTDNSITILRSVAADLAGCPEIRVTIKAHTDSIGSSELNQALSATRAKSVARQLYKDGVAIERLSARAFGESAPIDSNETEEGRRRNRRVELALSR